MPAEHYITGSCSISENSISKNGAQLFENRGAGVSGFLLSVYQHFAFNYPKFYKMDNLSKLGWLAAEILLQGGFKQVNYRPQDVGVVLANSNSSLDNDLKYFETIKDVPSPAVFVYTLPNIVTGEICIRNNFKGEDAFFIQDAFDAPFIAQQVNYLLGKDLLQACLCGWVEVLEEEYKAVLFLVEKTKNEVNLSFTAKNMNAIFNGHEL